MATASYGEGSREEARGYRDYYVDLLLIKVCGCPSLRPKDPPVLYTSVG